MLDANGILNKDMLEADFFAYALNFIRAKQRKKVDTSHYETSIKYLKRWLGDHLKFRLVDEKLPEKVKEYRPLNGFVSASLLSTAACSCAVHRTGSQTGLCPSGR